MNHISIAGLGEYRALTMSVRPMMNCFSSDGLSESPEPDENFSAFFEHYFVYPKLCPRIYSRL